MTEKPADFHVSGETLKNASVALAIAGTLISIINFAVTKIVAYDSYAPRIAKLEASEQLVHQVEEDGKARGFKIDDTKSNIDELKRQVDLLSSDVIQLRINTERINAILERKR